jgi:hypothetical protein
MKKQFIVVSLALSGKGNKIFRSGDLVEQSQLNRPVETLVKERHIKPVEETETTETTEEVIKHNLTNEDLEMNTDLVDEGLKVGDVVDVPIETTETTEEVIEDDKKEPLFFYEKVGIQIPVHTIDDIDLKAIKSLLKDFKIEFDNTKNKETLFPILVDHFKK